MQRWHFLFEISLVASLVICVLRLAAEPRSGWSGPSGPSPAWKESDLCSRSQAHAVPQVEVCTIAASGAVMAKDGVYFPPVRLKMICTVRNHTHPPMRSRCRSGGKTRHRTTTPKHLPRARHWMDE
ncbi:hypothetical protein B0T18DRAFT_76553 [Schizothecium vesticola]|uniref:Secreted protein n=1 Tax=Schizothecium vesticola TaxID=314040 RepID=A0AA40KAH9_9PEZI|nr:hypothetical protein B0T18DRAFT_76553 [Schizothecium vesticola]